MIFDRSITVLAVVLSRGWCVHACRHRRYRLVLELEASPAAQARHAARPRHGNELRWNILIEQPDAHIHTHTGVRRSFFFGLRL